MSGVNVAPQQAAALAELISENAGKGFAIGQDPSRLAERDLTVSFSANVLFVLGGRGKITPL